MKLVLRLVMVSLALATSLSFAQVQGGTPPFGSFGGGPFDTINLGNLNVHFSVPILHKAGRGTAFTYDMSYDNSIWYPSTTDGSTIWTPLPNWGWKGVTEAATGFVNYQLAEVVLTTGPNAGCTQDTYTFIYHDTIGVSHVFSPNIVDYLGGGSCLGSTTLPLTTHSVDSSGYKLVLASLSSGTLTARSGQVTNPPFNTGSGAGNYTDANGNQLTVNSSGQFFDTLSASTPALTVSGTPPTSTTFVYPGPSGNATYTMAYTSYSIHTAFSCTSPVIHEYTGSAYLVSKITLPDGSFYKFTYYSDGRLNVVTLPTGGTITYAYTGTHAGVNCADGSTIGMTRTLNPGGAWTYSRSDVSGSHWQTTVTTPPDPANSGAGDVTKIDFQEDNNTAPIPSNFYETQRLVYQGSTSGTLLATIYQCYNGVSITSPSSCPTTAVNPLPNISRVTKFTYLPSASGPEAETDLYYEGHGLLTDEYDYDYGGGVVGPLLRQANTTYNTALTNGIYDHPASITIKDSGGTTKATTSYTYDEDISSLTASGATQHVSITGSRGNLTTIASQANGTTTLYRKFNHYDTGVVKQAGGLSKTNAMANATTYTYASGTSCDFAFPTSIAEPLSLGTSATWDCGGGVPASTTDENSKVTNYSYDSMWRNTNVTYPDGGEIATTYDITATAPNIQTNRLITASHWIDTQTNLDGLGRTIKFESLSDPNGTATTDTTYDALGRVASVSHPYYTSSDPTYGVTTYSHDAFGRTTKVTNPDSTSKTFTYASHAVEITDESSLQKVLQWDGLGRLAYVCDGIGAGTQANGATASACNLDFTVNGFRADYGYDPMGNLTSVSYSGQTRSFAYDELSRMTSETNPESGTVTKVYDTGTAGDLYTKTSPKPNSSTGTVTATYTWDVLHRPTSILFSDSSPGLYYVYDASSEWGATLNNTKGRLAEQEHGAGTLASEIYSYDSMGRVTDSWSCQPDTCGTSTKHLGYTYNLLGETVNTADAGGGYTFTNNYNAIGEFTGKTSSLVDATHPGTLFSGATYNALGELTAGTFGDGIARSNTYNNMGRLTEIQDGPTATPKYRLYLGYKPNGSVAAYNDTLGGSWTYGYDAFNRLASSANSDTGVGYSYTYDQFGNRWQQHLTAGTGLEVDYTFNSSNRNTTSGFAYDDAGNLTSDGTCTPCWTYDDAGNVATANGATFTYDGFGQRVQKSYSGTTQDFIVGLDGHPHDEYQGGIHYRVTEGLFTYAQSEALFNRTDHQGTPRVTTDYTGATIRTESNGPFGDGYTETGSLIDFTGYANGFWDLENNADHFGAREYAKTQGRWLSPDPAGFAAVDVTNPQTWNRYAYALNDPVSFTDPLGLLVMACTDTFSSNGDGTYTLSDDCRVVDGGGGNPGGGGGGEGGSGSAGGNGGGGGGNGNGKKSAVDILRCAAKVGNSLSLAALLPQGSNQFLQNALSNDVSTVSDLATGPDRLSATSSLLQGKLTTTVAKAVGSIPVGPDVFTLGTNGAGTVFAQDVVTTPLAEKALGVAAGTLVSTAVDIKLAWDIATYAYGVAKCQ